MPRAVKFDAYSGLEVLKVVEVDRPTPGQGKVLVRVKAAGTNPGETMIREGGLPSAGLQRFLQARAVISLAWWRRWARGWPMSVWVMRSLDSPTTE